MGKGSLRLQRGVWRKVVGFVAVVEDQCVVLWMSCLFVVALDHSASQDLVQSQCLPKVPQKLHWVLQKFPLLSEGHCSTSDFEAQSGCEADFFEQDGGAI